MTKIIINPEWDEKVCEFGVINEVTEEIPLCSDSGGMNPCQIKDGEIIFKYIYK